MIAFRGFCLAALLALAFESIAELRVTITETSPAAPAVLAAGEPIFLRLEYSGAEHASLWARPYYQGQPVAKVRTNGSRPYEGSGTALAWFSLDAADKVDEVRIRTGGGRPYKESEVLRFPIDVRGSGQPAEHQSRAPWVAELDRENETLARAHRDTARAESPATDMLMFSGFGLTVLGFLALCLLGPLWALAKWSGAWRMLAALPLAVMAVVIGRIVIDTSRDPTSHNLWPFEVLMFGMGGAVFFSVLVLVRRVRAGSA